MDRFQAMQVFSSVAAEGSFAGAARQLGMSPAAVTRSIAALEQQIGARLFVRTTRRVTMTEAGSRYLLDCERILADVELAEAAAGGLHADPTGLLTITAPVLFGSYYIAPILTQFLDRYPRIEARLILLDRVTNLVEEGMDVAIRIGHLADSGMAAIRVGAVRRIVCVSPDYIEREGFPRIPEDLKRHNTISASNMRAIGEWRFKGDDGEFLVHVKPRLDCNTNAAVIAMVESGWGLSQMLSYQVGPSLEAGRLRLILEDFETDPFPVHIVHPEGRRASAKVRAFVDFAAEKLRYNPLVNPH